MYLREPHSNKSTLALLESASANPNEAIMKDPEVREAFEASLRSLAEDIIEYHPSLAHILAGMSEVQNPVIHGQN